MPAMPRIKGKPTQIAYAILGVPENMKAEKSPKKKKVEKELIFQETVRVR